MMNTQIARTLSAFAIVGTLGSAAWLGTAIAHAEPVTAPEHTWTCEADGVEVACVKLSEIDADSLPICHLEDGSDSVSKPCIWTNQGNSWLTFDEYSLLIMDDATR